MSGHRRKPESASNRIAEVTSVPIATRLAKRVRRIPLAIRMGTIGLQVVHRPFTEHQIKRYLARTDEPRLLIGAGPYVRDGWLSLDLIPLRPATVFVDATSRLPFQSASVAFIQCEHMIEHVPYPAAQRMLREFRRVLRSGGVLRIATPDLARLTDLIGRQTNPTQDRYVRGANTTAGLSDDKASNPVFVVNRMMHSWGHQFLYDDLTLAAALLDTGFTNLVWCKPGQSDHCELQDVERHQDEIGVEANEFETMVVEAMTPGAVG